MPKRRPAESLSLLLLFFVLLVYLLDSSLQPAAAQDVSPTPEDATPAGTPSIIPEIPTVGPVSVSYPIHGQTLKGTVNITGAIALEGWTSYELAFSDAQSGDASWFPFATGANPVVDGLLAAWDTTALTDGDYNLRLRVFGPGDPQDVFVYGLRMRNYTVDTPLPTPTFTATSTPTASPTPNPTGTPTATFTFTPLPTSTPFSTPTPLPPNPATLRPEEIVFNLGRGALFTAMLFGVFGLFLRLRAKRR